MSLYDGLGIGVDKDKPERDDLAGWSSGIKLLQSQLQLKKTVLTQNKRDLFKKGVVLPAVVDLKSRKEESDDTIFPLVFSQNVENRSSNANKLQSADPEWSVKDEYDPHFPNDYEKIIKEQRDKKEKEREDERRKEYEDRRRRNSDRYRDREDGDRGTPGGVSGIGGNAGKRRRNPIEEEEDDFDPRPRRANLGAAIAPPPSLTNEDDGKRDGGGNANYSSIGRGGSVALKIMAKYGFREGQGLGKQEQGMSQALQVEKTSKRGGKIIHEKDLPVKVESIFTSPAPPPPAQAAGNPLSTTPPQMQFSAESITETMKNPSKVVLLRNMVGPGEVDEDLEPETKEECGKYGEVIKCVIYEIPNTTDDEAVRIFVEFKRIESAIKAVVDLNGRYFGGRIVKGGFYNLDRFRRFDLAD